MSKAAILVDFHNVFGRNITNPTKIEIALKEIVQNALEQDDIDEIIVRLYDGWYENDSLSNEASDIMTKLHNIEPIPPFFRGKVIRGRMEFATGLFKDDFVWYNTYRHVKGPRLQLSSSLKNVICHTNTLIPKVLFLSNSTNFIKPIFYHKRV